MGGCICIGMGTDCRRLLVRGLEVDGRSAMSERTGERVWWPFCVKEEEDFGVPQTVIRYADKGQEQQIKHRV